jgi:hypothetical protein
VVLLSHSEDKVSRGSLDDHCERHTQSQAVKGTTTRLQTPYRVFELHHRTSKPTKMLVRMCKAQNGQCAEERIMSHCEPQINCSKEGTEFVPLSLLF